MGVERDALHLKLTTMRLFLPEAEHGPLDEYESAVDQAIASFAAGQVEVAREEIDAAKATGRQLKRDFAAEPPKEPGGESIGKQLVPQKTYP